MRENRYSFASCAKFSGLNSRTIYNRARKLGIETEYGISAAELKNIIEFKSKQARRDSYSKLCAEMEGLYEA